MNCVYCVDNEVLSPRQVLLRGEHLFVCAPRGQIIEGFLAIAPFRCIGCIAQFPAAYFVEMARLIAIVGDFYRRAYGVARGTFYEQGRAGGACRGGPGFPLHAHLCCLPASLDLHSGLAQEYVVRPVSSLRDLVEVGDREPYIYVDGGGERRAYVAAAPEGRVALWQSRLRHRVATLAGVPGKGPLARLSG